MKGRLEENRKKNEGWNKDRMTKKATIENKKRAGRNIAIQLNSVTTENL